MRWSLLPEWMAYLILAFGIWYWISPHQAVSTPYTSVTWWRESAWLGRAALDPAAGDLPVFQSGVWRNREKILWFDSSGDVRGALAVDPSGDTAVSVSGESAALYQKVGREIVLQKFNGERLWTLESFSYPLLSPTGKRLALLVTDTTSLSILDANRNLLVSNFFLGTLMTDYAWCTFNEDLVVGTVDGDLWRFDFQGRSLGRLRPGPSSKVPVIKGVAVSRTGQYVAALSGKRPEMLSLYSREGDLRWQTETEYNRTERTGLHIDEDNRLVLEQVPEGVRVRSLVNGRILYVFHFSAFAREPTDWMVADTAPGGLLVGLSGPGGRVVFYARPEGRVVWKRDWADRDLSVLEICRTRPSDFLVGTSDLLLAFRLHEAVE